MRFVIFCPGTDKKYQQRLKNKNRPLGEVGEHTKGKAASPNIVSADMAIIIFRVQWDCPPWLRPLRSDRPARTQV